MANDNDNTNTNTTHDDRVSHYLDTISESPEYITFYKSMFERVEELVEKMVDTGEENRDELVTDVISCVMGDIGESLMEDEEVEDA